MKTKARYKALEMEEFVIFHQIPSQKNVAHSVQVTIGDANLTFALLLNYTDYTLSLYC